MARENRHTRPQISLGAQTLGARLHALFRTTLVLLLCWLGLWAITATWAIQADTTVDQRYFCLKWNQARLVAAVLQLPRYPMHYSDADGTHAVTAGQLYGWSALAQSARWVNARALVRIRQCALASFLLTALLAWGLHRLGSRLRGDHRLRGGYLVSAKELAKEIRRRKQASSIAIGGVPLIAGSETLHMLVRGATGTGKSVLLHGLVDQLGRRLPFLIYDTKGDFTAKHYDPAQGDVVLSFLDARCPAWTLWDEIESDADATLVAEILIPCPPSTPDPFWTKAARQLLADILRTIPPVQRTNQELARVVLLAGVEELQSLLRSTVAGTYFSDAKDDRTAKSIRVTLTTHLQALSFLAPTTRPGDGFSMRRWLRESVQHRTAGRIFLTCPPAQAAALSPLVSVLMESAAMSLMTLGPDRDRRVGFLLDEFPTLPAMPTMERLMAEGRGYGAVVILAAQANAQIRKTYGNDSAETLASLCSTQVVFRLNEPASADVASKLLGEAEYDESKETDGHGHHGTTTSLASQRVLRRAVLPSEILSLPDLTCFLKVAGAYPVAKVQLTVVHRPTVAPTYVAKPTEPRGSCDMPTKPIGNEAADKGLI